MRQESAAIYKTDRRGVRRKQTPDPNSLAGRMLDAMRSGQWVSGNSFDGVHNGRASRAVESLRSFYGFEIESKNGRNGGYRLLGEWEGPYFVPIERMEHD